jgi:hypothetical protein
VTKQSEETTLDLDFQGLPEGAMISGVEDSVVLAPGEETTKTMMILVPVDQYKGEFTFTIEATVSPGDFKISDTIDFLGPSAYILNQE